MERLYIIDPNNFKGNCINTMSSTEGTPQYVDYTNHYNKGVNFTFQEYKSFKDNQNLIAVSYDQISLLIHQYNNEHVIKDWEETTEDDFYSLFECLPPLSVKQFKGGFYFICSEAYTGDIHSFGAEYNEKYYLAKFSLRKPNHEVIEQLKSVYNNEYSKSQ